MARNPRLNERNSSHWKKLRQRILERDGWVCYICNGEATTVDHVIPLAKGGTDDWENLAACCRSCNFSKQDKILGVDFLVGDSTATLPRGFLSPKNGSISHE